MNKHQLCNDNKSLLIVINEGSRKCTNKSSNSTPGLLKQNVNEA